MIAVAARCRDVNTNRYFLVEVMQDDVNFQAWYIMLILCDYWLTLLGSGVSVVL
jgi:hypothetical protein